MSVCDQDRSWSDIGHESPNRAAYDPLRLPHTRSMCAMIGEDWFHVKNDDQLKRGDLSKALAKHASYFKSIKDPDFLQRCLRLWEAMPEIGDADAWAVSANFHNDHTTEPYRTVNLMNQWRKAIRLENSENDPNREINVLDRSNNIKSTVICGDCRTILAGMASESVDNVITSPPYHGQRDFEHESQIGQEDSYLDFIFEVTPECFGGRVGGLGL
jgi:hypothetical protein